MLLARVLSSEEKPDTTLSMPSTKFFTGQTGFQGEQAGMEAC